MNDKMTREESMELSRTLFEKISSNDPELVKQGQDIATRYTKRMIREGGFYRKLMPMEHAPDNQLDRSVDDVLPSITLDLEPNSPGAMAVPFRTMTDNKTMKGPRYRCSFSKIMTNRLSIDVDELRTYRADLRQITTDLMVNDLSVIEDGDWLRQVNKALIGPDVTHPQTGTRLYKKFNDSISPQTIVRAFGTLDETPFNVPLDKVIANSMTFRELMAFSYSEVGDVAVDFFKKGFTHKQIYGQDIMTTTKKGLVPNGSIYGFAHPEYLGRSFYIYDATVFTKSEAQTVLMYAYQMIGGAIGNIAGVMRCDFPY